MNENKNVKKIDKNVINNIFCSKGTIEANSNNQFDEMLVFKLSNNPATWKKLS